MLRVVKQRLLGEREAPAAPHVWSFQRETDEQRQLRELQELHELQVQAQRRQAGARH